MLAGNAWLINFELNSHHEHYLFEGPGGVPMAHLSLHRTLPPPAKGGVSTEIKLGLGVNP